MSNFWNLVGFEYKKILCKKSVQIALLLAFLATVLGVGGTLLGSSYIDGKVSESNYDAMVRDRAYARALDGRILNEELIMEAVKAYAKIPEANQYQSTQEYQKLARPYSGLYSIIRTIYNTESQRFNMEDFQLLTEEQAGRFYATRRQKQVQLVGETGMSDKAKEKVLGLDAQIETPFTFSYTDGYTRFFVILYTTSLMSAFVMAVCIAPLFSGEYSTGTDQLLLASRHGKNRLIKAKLFTGFSLAAAICLLLTAVTYIFSMCLFGFDGGSAPLQLYVPMSPYPLTMGQTALLLSICTFFAGILAAAITMLLSARLTSPFGVIILISLLLIVPLFINVSETYIWLYNLFHLLPTNMSSLPVATDGIQYEFFGLVVRPYVFLPLFAAAVSVLLTPFAYRSFKNHQVQ